MDASIGADQSGLSDLSAASDTSMGPYLAEDTPILIDQHLSEDRSALDQTTPSQLNPATPLPRVSHASPRFRSETPVRESTASAASAASAAWTPSPDASSSRSSASARLRAARKASPRSSKDANESIGSSLGTFDYSNASFSESFLRQAGAHMLAGLDEATHQSHPSPSSSSPRYRTSSSPTVTARPLRADPRTPFTGKSLRTRMAEAGVLDSPASSDGSSPSSSPTARIGYHASQLDNQSTEGQPAYSTAHSPSSFREPGSALKLPLQASNDPSSCIVDENSVAIAAQEDWQEGLSMVPEESFVEDASSLSLSREDRLGSLQNQQDPQEHRAADASLSSSHTSPSSHPDVSRAVEPRSPAALESPSSGRSTPLPLSETNSPAQAMAAPVSPSPNSRPSTPKSAPRQTNTPKSFVRLRMVTPARSSPLSKVVNFSPASASSSHLWQSPTSHKGSDTSGHVTPSQDLSQIGTSRGLTSSPLEDEAHEASKLSWDTSNPMSSARAPESSSEATGQERYESPLPNTPRAGMNGSATSLTPSRLWSPATSASFATPASQHPQHPSTTPQASTSSERHILHAACSPDATFGTPKWSPSPAPSRPAPDEVMPLPSPLDSPIQDEPDSRSLSSSCSSSSGRKQSGSTSLPLSSSASPSPDVLKKPSTEPAPQRDLGLYSPPPQDSPSAARFSRMQLARTPSASAASLVPELAGVASAFDSLAEVSEGRVARLVAQLQASTAYIDTLEAALERDEAQHREAWTSQETELAEVRDALAQLSVQYDELVKDAEAKDARMVELVKDLQSSVSLRGGQREVELERQLEEERRLREVERRDFEVRVQALRSTSSQGDAREASPEEARAAEREVEQARMELRATLEKDFAVRRAIEEAPLRTRIRELELALEAVSSADTAQEHRELQKQVDTLTADLDRRFEELCDVRAELDNLAALHDAAEQRTEELQQDLDAAHAELEARTESVQPLPETPSGSAVQQDELTLQKQIDTLTADLDRRFEELCDVRAELDDMATRHEAAEQRAEELQCELDAKQAELEAHHDEAEPKAEPTTPRGDRVAALERQLANVELELLRVRKAHDALAEDNMQWSIALAAKQLELGMVKRNARFALKSRNPRILPELEKVQSKPEAVGAKMHQASQEEKVKAEKVDEPTFPAIPTAPLIAPNRAREHARKLLAQRRAMLAA